MSRRQSSGKSGSLICTACSLKECPLTRAQLQCILASFGSQSTTKAPHLCMSRPHDNATGKADARRSGNGSGPAELLIPSLLIHVPTLLWGP